VPCTRPGLRRAPLAPPAGCQCWPSCAKALQLSHKRAAHSIREPHKRAEELTASAGPLARCRHQGGGRGLRLVALFALRGHRRRIRLVPGAPHAARAARGGRALRPAAGARGRPHARCLVSRAVMLRAARRAPGGPHKPGDLCVFSSAGLPRPWMPACCACQLAARAVTCRGAWIAPGGVGGSCGG